MSKEISQIVKRAIIRALSKMEDQEDRPVHRFRAGEINGWKGDALASYVTPNVLRALRRALEKRKVSKKPRNRAKGNPGARQ